MEQRFKTSEQDIDLLPLCEFIEQERLRVGAQAGMGDPTRRLAFVTK